MSGPAHSFGKKDDKQNYKQEQITILDKEFHTDEIATLTSHACHTCCIKLKNLTIKLVLNIAGPACIEELETANWNKNCHHLVLLLTSIYTIYSFHNKLTKTKQIYNG